MDKNLLVFVTPYECRRILMDRIEGITSTLGAINHNISMLFTKTPEHSINLIDETNKYFKEIKDEIREIKSITDYIKDKEDHKIQESLEVEE